MNLGEMTRRGASPRRIKDALLSHFDSVEMEDGNGIWNFVLVCRDDFSVPRLRVSTFYSRDNRWIYDITSTRAGRRMPFTPPKAQYQHPPMRLAA